MPIKEILEYILRKGENLRKVELVWDMWLEYLALDLDKYWFEFPIYPDLLNKGDVPYHHCKWWWYNGNVVTIPTPTTTTEV